MSASSVLSALNAPLATGRAVAVNPTAAEGVFADLLAAETADVAVIAPSAVRTPPPPPTTEPPVDSEADAAAAEATEGLGAAPPTNPPLPALIPAPPPTNAASDNSSTADASGAAAGGTATPPAYTQPAPVPEQPRSEPIVTGDDAPKPVVAAALADDAPRVPEQPAAPTARDLGRVAQTGADVIKAALASGGPFLAPARVTALRAPSSGPVAAATTGQSAATGEGLDVPPPPAAAPAARPDAGGPVASTLAAPAADGIGIKSADPRITNALVEPQAGPSLDGHSASQAAAISATAPSASATLKAEPTVGQSPLVEPIVIPAQAALEAPAGNGTAPTPETAALLPTVAETSLSSLSRATIETTAQLAAQISRRLEGRSTRFELALTPDGLGRVDVSLDIDADGQLAARLAFDNPLAATDLRGRADELRRQLEDAGFTLARDALEFSGRDGSSGGGQAFDRRQGRAAAYANRNAAADAEALTAPTPWINPHPTPRGVDLKV